MPIKFLNIVLNQNVFFFGKTSLKSIKYLIINYQNIQKHFQKPSSHILTIIAQEPNQGVPKPNHLT